VIIAESDAAGLHQQVKPLGRPRRRLVLVTLGIALAAGAVLAALTLRSWGDGPLTADEENVSVTVPIAPGKTGVAWGNLELHNPTSSPLTLDSVTLTPASAEKLVTRIYVWDEDRLPIANSRTMIVWTTPLPKEWDQVPRHPVAGHVVPPEAESSEEIKIGPEIVIEFAVPERAVTVTAITIHYHAARHAHQKTFQNAITICPPTDPNLCKDD
jgi:hypothetical protein